MMENNDSPTGADADPVSRNMVVVVEVPVASSPDVARRSPTSTPTSESTGLNLAVCDWTDVHEDDSGNATGVLSYQWKELFLSDVPFLPRVRK